MTEQELQAERRQRWRLDGRGMRTLEEARAFVEAVGFCLMYPLSAQEAAHRAGPGQTALLLPTFMGAYAGGDEDLPTAQRAFADARAGAASELMVRLLRERAAFEANIFGESNFLIAGSVFPYFYALVGDRNPRQEARADRTLSPLAQDVLGAIQREGPVSKGRLRQTLGGELSDAALERALHELWSRLRITRVDYSPREGASWDVLYRWAAEAVNEGAHLSVAEALSALLSKYLEAVVAAEQKEIEEVFGTLVPRSRVKEAVNALLAARELGFVHVGSRSLIQVAPPRTVAERKPRRA